MLRATARKILLQQYRYKADTRVRREWLHSAALLIIGRVPFVRSYPLDRQMRDNPESERCTTERADLVEEGDPLWRGEAESPRRDTLSTAIVHTDCRKERIGL